MRLEPARMQHTIRVSLLSNLSPDLGLASQVLKVICVQDGLGSGTGTGIEIETGNGTGIETGSGTGTDLCYTLKNSLGTVHEGVVFLQNLKCCCN